MIPKKNNYTKEFKFSVKTPEGKILLKEIAEFGSKENPFPSDWEENPLIQMSFREYERALIDRHFVITMEEDCKLDI
jgi:hypothetical protein